MSKLEQSGVNFDQRWTRDNSVDVAERREESAEEAAVPQPLTRPELRALLLKDRGKK
jgi:hypothetical protein